MRAVSFAVAAALALVSPALAQTYPAKPVRIIVPFSAGGPIDAIARVMAQKLSERLGKQFFVENIPAGGSNVGMATAAKAAGDGYTMLIHGSSLIVNPSLYAKIAFDPFRDFAPVTLVGRMPNIVTVHPSIPARSVSELVALVKANPGKYSYAHPGTGTTPHLFGELFKLTFGLDIVTVPFNGAAPAIQSVVAGHTPIAFIALPPVASNIKSGNLRALALLASQRSATLPDVPTMEESGIRGHESDTMTGVVVPAGTPKEIVKLLHREIVAAFALPDVRDRLAGIGFDTVVNTPAQFDALLKAEVSKWADVIKAAKIRID